MLDPPENVKVPRPILVNPGAGIIAAPEITPDMVPVFESATCTSDAALIVTAPLSVPFSVKLITPDDATPVPAMVIGSDELNVPDPATSSTAPDAMVVAPESAPKAAEVVTTTVPVSMLVAPVYVLDGPDNVRVLALDTVFLTWPAPVMLPDKVWAALEAKFSVVPVPREIAPAYVPEFSCPAVPITRVPPESLRVVAPLYVFIPVRVSVPEPAFVSPPVPPMTPANVVSESAPLVWSSPVVRVAEPRVITAPVAPLVVAIEPTVSLLFAKSSVVLLANETAERSGMIPAAPDVIVPKEITVVPV